MGYITAYSLSISPSTADADAIIEDFLDTCEGASYAINEDGTTEEPCKWYDHETDLKSFSKKYPDVLFILEGEGEESGDIWKLYVQNGKSHRIQAVMTFDPFDPTQLS
jgi:hypothetical protein